MDGQLLIDRTVLLTEKTAKTVESRIILKKYVVRLKQQMRPKPRVNDVDDTISEAATVGTSLQQGSR